MLVNSAKKVLIRVPKIQLRLTLAKDQGFLSDGRIFYRWYLSGLEWNKANLLFDTLGDFVLK